MVSNSSKRCRFYKTNCVKHAAKLAILSSYKMEPKHCKSCRFMKLENVKMNLLLRVINCLGLTTLYKFGEDNYCWLIVACGAFDTCYCIFVHFSRLSEKLFAFLHMRANCVPSKSWDVTPLPYLFKLLPRKYKTLCIQNVACYLNYHLQIKVLGYF